MKPLKDIFESNDIQALKKLNLKRHGVTLTRLCYEYANINILRYLERKGISADEFDLINYFEIVKRGLHGSGTVSVDAYKNFIRYFFKFQFPKLTSLFVKSNIQDLCKYAYINFLHANDYDMLKFLQKFIPIQNTRYMYTVQSLNQLDYLLKKGFHVGKMDIEILYKKNVNLTRALVERCLQKGIKIYTGLGGATKVSMHFFIHSTAITDANLRQQLMTWESDVRNKASKTIAKSFKAYVNSLKPGGSAVKKAERRFYKHYPLRTAQLHKRGKPNVPRRHPSPPIVFSDIPISPRRKTPEYTSGVMGHARAVKTYFQKNNAPSGYNLRSKKRARLV